MTTRTRRPKIDRNEFLALNAAGKTLAELAEHFAANPRTISRIRTELGLSHEYLGRPITPERRNRIQQMLDDGWSHAEIHRTEGADPDTIRKHFPGTAWTKQQQAEYVATLRTINPHFNRRPRTNNTHPYGATKHPQTSTPTHRGPGAAQNASQGHGGVMGHAA